MLFRSSKHSAPKAAGEIPENGLQNAGKGISIKKTGSKKEKPIGHPFMPEKQALIMKGSGTRGKYDVYIWHISG